MRRIAGPLFVVIVPMLGLSAGSAVDPCPAEENRIVCENMQIGNPPSEWDIVESPNSVDAELKGFATTMSVNRGGTVQFKISTSASLFRVDIYRIGYYGGQGARKVATLGDLTGPRNWPDSCMTDLSVGLVDCGNWNAPVSWNVPETAVSGVYIAKLVRRAPEDGRSNHIIFIVRDDASRSKLLFQTSDPTWQAYNAYGGYSLYVGRREPNNNCATDVPSTNGRAFKVSYNRPFAMLQIGINCETLAPPNIVNGWFRDGAIGNVGGHGFFSAEYPMVRFLEKNGYDVTYISGLDVDKLDDAILDSSGTRKHDVFLSVGHDEYWSDRQRWNVERARAAGVHLAFFSGNEVYIKTRWETSIVETHISHRTLVTYKEPADTDTTSPVWTGLWAAESSFPNEDGGRPQNALTGTLYGVVDSVVHGLAVPDRFRDLRFWRHVNWSGVPQDQQLSHGVLGYEWDEAPQDASTPAGLIRLSETIWNDAPADSGKTTWVHNLTLYRHASGALVFSAGAVQWSWALEQSAPFFDRAGGYQAQQAIPELRLQQATVNLLADMGAQPATPASNLVTSAASADTLPPTVNINIGPISPTTQWAVPVTISGSASDAGGGVIAAVEVSFDGGSTWERATGTTAWTINWTPFTLGTWTIRARAIDDSGNIGAVDAERIMSVRHCPCSLFGDAAPPPPEAVADGPIELGVRFSTDFPGWVLGLKFHKATGETSPNTGRLWSGTGVSLDTLTFTTQSATGWREGTFTQPIPISPGTPYVASYTANAKYPGNRFFFEQPLDRAPLHAYQDAAPNRNGVYTYTTGTYPTQTYSANNYWVDVVYNFGACVFTSLQSAVRGWWRFDELTGTMMNDQAPVPHHRTLTGTTRTNGIFGQARSFNGVGDHLSVGAIDELKLTSGEISINVWVKPERLDGYVLGYATKNANWGLYSVFLESGYPTYGYYDENGAANKYRCNMPLTDDKFWMVTFTYRMGDAASMGCYVNGTLVSGQWFGSGMYRPHLNAGDQEFEIGHWFGTPVGNPASATDVRYFFKGVIDEPLVARGLLTVTQVQALYTNSCRDAGASCPTAPSTGHLRGSWRFNETAGASVRDDSPNALLHGNATGTAIVEGRWARGRRFTQGDKVSVGDVAPLQLVSDGMGMTVSAWIQPESDTGFVLGYAEQNANWGIFSVFLENGHPSYGYFDGTLRHKFRCNASVPTSRFSMVTFAHIVGDGGTMQCFINGKPVSGQWVEAHGNAPPAATTPASRSFEIGHWFGTPVGQERHWFNGVIDEVLVFAHKLTPAEVAAMTCR